MACGERYIRRQSKLDGANTGHLKARILGPYANGKLPALHAGIEGSTPSGSTSRGALNRLLVKETVERRGLAERNTESPIKTLPLVHNLPMSGLSAKRPLPHRRKTIADKRNIRVAYPEESIYATATCREKGQGLASPVKGANPT